MAYYDFIEDLEGEVWAYVEGKSRYQVSNKGRVKSLLGRETLLLKQQINDCGYSRVCLSLERGKPKYYLVSRLVAREFIQNDDVEIKTTVHHKDRNKQNNTVENLQWLSHKDNVAEYYSSRQNNGKEQSKDSKDQ